MRILVDPRWQRERAYLFDTVDSRLISSGHPDPCRTVIEPFATDILWEWSIVFVEIVGQ